MEKKTGKFLAKEVLYLLLMVLVMTGATAFQLILKDEAYLDAYFYYGGSFLGSYYDYNWFFYIAGLKLYVLGLVALYQIVLKKDSEAIKEFKTLGIILYFVFGVVFSILGFMASFLASLFMLGLFDNISPLAWKISAFGMPLFQLVFLLYLFGLKRKRKENQESEGMNLND